MTLGLQPDLVVRSTAFVIDAYAHALQQHNDVAPNWILANIYAARTELAEFEKAGMGYQYVFHLGLGNDAGAVFQQLNRSAKPTALWLGSGWLTTSFLRAALWTASTSTRRDADTGAVISPKHGLRKRISLNMQNLPVGNLCKHKERFPA